jgi:uncharacterized protein (DUF302 family)
MTYYMSKTVNLTFDEAVSSVKQTLARNGFGVLTDIDVQATLKEKIGAEIDRYRILGACNPAMAFRALQVEDKIGTMLPCNVVVRQDQGQIEIAAVDPVASMQAVDNPSLQRVAEEVRELLRTVVNEAGEPA